MRIVAILLLALTGGDERSADPMVDDLRARFPDEQQRVVALGQMDELEIGWDRFNLKPGKCHPSAYGQKMIARAVAARLDS